MNRLAPSVLSFDLCDLARSVPALVRGGADVIHVDVMDGQFVPPISFGDAMVKSLRRHTDAPIEVHLMIEDAERQLEAFVKAGANRVLVHAEVEPHLYRLILRLKELGVEAGVALNPATPLGVLDEVLPLLDMVLVMTVTPGWGGQPMIPSMLDKVRRLRERYEGLIEVDGGMDHETIPQAREAGADVFVVGSVLARAKDPEAAARRLKELIG